MILHIFPFLESIIYKTNSLHNTFINVIRNYIFCSNKINYVFYSIHFFLNKCIVILRIESFNKNKVFNFKTIKQFRKMYVIYIQTEEQQKLT